MGTAKQGQQDRRGRGDGRPYGTPHGQQWEAKGNRGREGEHGGARYSDRQRSDHTNPWAFALELGFFAGLIWGGVHWLMYALSFTKVVPGILLEPFLQHSFLTGRAGQTAGYLSFIAFSAVAALIYVLLLRRLRGPWPGIVYGVIWWALIFLAGSWLFLMQPPFRLPWNSVISEFCLYLLWGMFIGYTTATEYTDERKRDQQMGMA